MFNNLFLGVMLLTGAVVSEPAPPGRLVDIGGQRVHLHCTGQGAPTVVIENGFDEFSSDWMLVQERVQSATRVCTYDRAGYGWSDPGRMPRTFAQINLELRETLRKAHEKGPYVLIGHSFGGPAVRNFAMLYPRDVAGVVLVDSVEENQRVIIQGKAVRLRDSVTGLAIPPPTLATQPALRAPVPIATPRPVRPPLDRLPEVAQRQHQWADLQPDRDAAANSERTWSPEYFALWASAPEKVTLRDLPLIVLTREKGGYREGLDMSPADLEAARLASQLHLAQLSSKGEQRIVPAGHDMQLEAPEIVAAAILDMVRIIRK